MTVVAGPLFAAAGLLANLICPSVAEKPQSSPSWWQTVPGILTGVAALITAVTGLMVALNHAGSRTEERVTPSSQSVPGGAPGRSPHARLGST